MPTYKIDGKDYSAIDLQNDLKRILEVKKAKDIVKEAENRNLTRLTPFQGNDAKAKFLEEILGHGSLRGHWGPVNAAKPIQIGRVFYERITSFMSLARSDISHYERRIAEYSRLDSESLDKELEQARIALETFKREHPEKYHENVMVALRA